MAKATGQERYPDAVAPSKAAEKPAAVSNADRSRVSFTAVFLDNTQRVLNVNKCIPHEVIIDTRTVIVMLTTKFAKALGVNFSTLTPGPDFVTAEGKEGAAMDTTPQPLEFVLSSGTHQELRVHLPAIIVDTNAYCAILGMEFISAVKGGYNSHTELFMLGPTLFIY